MQASGSGDPRKSSEETSAVQEEFENSRVEAASSRTVPERTQCIPCWARREAANPMPDKKDTGFLGQASETLGQATETLTSPFASLARSLKIF